MIQRSVFSSGQFKSVLYRATALFLTFVLLPGSSLIASAHPQSQNISAAERAIAEGRKLRSQGLANEAIAKYEEARALFESAGDSKAEAGVLNIIGQIYFGLGEMQRALEYHNRALPRARAAGDRLAESDTLKAIGAAHRVLGETYKALDYYQQAIVLAREAGDRGRETWLLSAIGLVYYGLGEHQKSLDTYNQGLLLARANGYQGAEATILSHMGSVYDMLGDKQKALDSLNQSLGISRTRGERGGQAGALQSIGRVYHSMGEYQKAIDYLNQSLPLSIAARSRTSEARAHYNIGKAYVELGEHQQALDHLNQALQVYKAVGERTNIAATIHLMARDARNRGNLAEALTQINAALDIIEWMRARAVTQELRASYLASVQKYYELKIEVLTRLDKLDSSKNHAAAALQVSEMARARSLLDTLVESGADIRQDVSTDLLERERSIQQQLSSKAAEQMRLLGGEYSKEQLTTVERQIEELSAQYQEVQAEIRSTSPRYAALMQPRPLSLEEIQRQVLDPQTVLLEYYLGEEHSYLWAVTQDSIKSYELPKREEIEKSARLVYDLLTARNRRMKFETVEEKRARVEKADAQYAQAASTLSRMVLEPVAQQIVGKRLLIVADGALQYVPFAALPSPRAADYQPLSIGHEIVVLPSASTLAVLRHETAGRKPAPRSIAVLADPVFGKDDQRVKVASAKNRASQSNIIAQARDEVERSARESGWGEGGLRIARLPFTRKEAEVIAALVPATGRKEALDFEASRASASSSELSKYRIVHFATHGFLNSAHPELSGVVLSLVDEEGRDQDGFLRAHEIYNLKLPAELVVLSGCRTGLGKEIRGEGLVGLTRAFMYAGAARVVVSLWDINDKATADFMARFYRAMFGKERMRPAAALRAAQVSMWKERRWPSPYYWAAFVLQGETR